MIRLGLIQYDVAVTIFGTQLVMETQNVYNILKRTKGNHILNQLLLVQPKLGPQSVNSFLIFAKCSSEGMNHTSCTLGSGHGDMNFSSWEEEARACVLREDFKEITCRAGGRGLHQTDSD